MARTRWRWARIHEARAWVAVAWLGDRYACFVATPRRPGVAELVYVDAPVVVPERDHLHRDVVDRIARAALILAEPRAGPKRARGR